MRFKFFGTEIYISFLFCTVVAFIIATDRTGLALPTLFCALLHETGHLVAMWICDCEPKTIKLVIGAVSISRGISKKKNGDIFISLAGPLLNLIMFISLYFNYRYTKYQFSFDVAVISLAFFMFNMLPVSGLDGGIILKEILYRKTNDIYKADRTVRIITLIIGLFLSALGITILINGKTNITVFIVGLYILISAFLRN